MRILVDTDVLLDVALGREPWSEASRSLLNWCQQGRATCFVAWHSMLNLFYYLRRHEASDAKAFLGGLLGFAQIAPVGTEDMLLALKLGFADLEDAMQVASAVACEADLIATRNTKDYTKSPIPVATPAEVLQDNR